VLTPALGAVPATPLEPTWETIWPTALALLPAPPPPLEPPAPALCRVPLLAELDRDNEAAIGGGLGVLVIGTFGASLQAAVLGPK
jgi:hypothetical protein